jgi:CBS-domain-containing membrane protein
MTPAVIYSTAFASLDDTDTVAVATRRMLESHVTDLPVIDSTGKLLGMFKLQQLFAVLLPKAATMDFGMQDLSFVSETVAQLRERMREIEAKPVGQFLVAPEHAVHPETSPLEIVLLLYKGENAVPVVTADGGKLVGMVGARDVLAALQPDGAR